MGYFAKIPTPQYMLAKIAPWLQIKLLTAG
jgi:hypothetical protein